MCICAYVEQAILSCRRDSHALLVGGLVHEPNDALALGGCAAAVGWCAGGHDRRFLFLVPPSNQRLSPTVPDLSPRSRCLRVFRWCGNSCQPCRSKLVGRCRQSVSRAGGASPRSVPPAPWKVSGNPGPTLNKATGPASPASLSRLSLYRTDVLVSLFSTRDNDGSLGIRQ